ncbi:MAG: RNase H family protein [Candidatus Saccharimonadales bacterium]
MITYYTDGSASPNPGPGGFSVIKELQPHILGSEEGDTTNIRMEGKAILAAIHDSAGEQCEIFTDSEFWINVITKWAPNWEAKGWKKPGGEIKNLDIVREVYPLYKKSNATLTWVRGHEGDIGNEMADEWANKARENGDVGPVFVKEQAPKNAEEYVDEFLALGQVMQLATSNDNSPWISTVYYVADSERNIYWLSLPERRHSKEVTSNPHVAIAIAIKQDIPVIGIQAAGSVEIVGDTAVVETILASYVKKYDGAGKEFHQRFVDGKNKHQLYKMTPDLLALFDEVHFKENPVQKII